jgi:hypothetical protein
MDRLLRWTTHRVSLRDPQHVLGGTSPIRLRVQGFWRKASRSSSATTRSRLSSRAVSTCVYPGFDEIVFARCNGMRLRPHSLHLHLPTHDEDLDPVRVVMGRDLHPLRHAEEPRAYIVFPLPQQTFLHLDPAYLSRFPALVCGRDIFRHGYLLFCFISMRGYARLYRRPTPLTVLVRLAPAQQAPPIAYLEEGSTPRGLCVP